MNEIGVCVVIIQQYIRVQSEYKENQYILIYISKDGCKASHVTM